MVDFLKQHPIAAVFGVIGAFMTVGGIVLDGLEMMNAGWPGYVWAAIGASITIISVFAVVLRQHAVIGKLKMPANQDGIAPDFDNYVKPEDDSKDSEIVQLRSDVSVSLGRSVTTARCGGGGTE